MNLDLTNIAADTDKLDGLDSTAFAKLNGDNTQRFKIANAVDVDDALAKGQLLNEIKAIDGDGSGIDADKLNSMEPSELPISTAVQAELDRIDAKIDNGEW